MNFLIKAYLLVTEAILSNSWILFLKVLDRILEMFGIELGIH